MWKKLFMAMLALLCLGIAFAEEPLREGPWEYVLTEEGAVITEYLVGDENPDPLLIPATLGGQPVVGIAEGAFTVYGGEVTFECNSPHLTNADGFLIDTQTSTLLYSSPSSQGKPLPAVRRLGRSCTWNWLTGWGEMDVVIPEGVEEIAWYAFYDGAAKSLTLPESLRLIESCAFEAFDVEELPIVIPEGAEMLQYGAFGLSYQFGEWGLYEDPDMIIELGASTHLETYEEYVIRTGDDSWDWE